MKTITHKLQACAAGALLAAALLPLAAHADTPGHHPGYLHALTDLQDARWNLKHRPGDPAVGASENEAVIAIDATIDEVRKAAATDAKDLGMHPAEDAHLDRPGRLHQAEQLLQKAKQDLSEEEDNRNARGAQLRALRHLERALHATERAIREVESHR
ncbi:hypothetical protein [Pelomonas sp. KK5]|uniref:hypothetical protein n=1 Tax=Pelomonas sp. KK5 TaxID=1855730 RepID=UPI00097CABD8|nr:hypothetical protein [Pelomonas sp. KK5]